MDRYPPAPVCPAPLPLQGRWVRVLTNVEPVVDATLALLPIFCLAQIGDAVNVSLQALLWGGGKQKVKGRGCLVQADPKKKKKRSNG